MTWLYLSTILLFIIGEILIISKHKVNVIIGIIIIVYFIIMAIFYKKFPTALDVYQGKTDIENVYKDGVKIDSFVVFKNIKYERN